MVAQGFHIDGVRDGRLRRDDEVGLLVDKGFRHIENPLDLLGVGEPVLLLPRVGVLLHDDRFDGGVTVNLPFHQLIY